MMPTPQHNLAPPLPAEPFRFSAWEGPVGLMALPHSHPDVEVNLLLHGQLTYIHGGGQQRLLAGQLTAFWAGLPHIVYDISADARMLWLIIPLSDFLSMDLPAVFTRALLKGDFARADTDLAGRDRIDRHLLQGWVQDLHEPGPAAEVARREVSARLHRLALVWRSSPSTAHLPAGAARQALRVFEILSRQSTTLESVQEIAGQVGLHPKYLMQNFKRTFGIGLWEYLMRMRIGHAQRLLLTTDTSVTGAAMQSGFSTTSAFYRAFRLYTNGMTPAAFRKTGAALGCALSNAGGPAGVRAAAGA
jgi:AraC-like DNA-binding protein